MTLYPAWFATPLNYVMMILSPQTKYQSVSALEWVELAENDRHPSVIDYTRDNIGLRTETNPSRVFGERLAGCAGSHLLCPAPLPLLKNGPASIPYLLRYLHQCLAPASILRTLAQLAFASAPWSPTVDVRTAKIGIMKSGVDGLP